MEKRSLTPRERILIVCALLILVGITVPLARGLAEKYRDARQELQRATDRLDQARLIRETVIEERHDQQIIQELIASRSPGFDLYSYTNETMLTQNIQHLGTLQSQGSMSGGSLDAVRLTLRGVNMKQLLNLLHTLYASDNLIAMQRLRYLRPSGNAKGLDCEITLVAPKSQRA